MGATRAQRVLGLALAAVLVASPAQANPEPKGTVTRAEFRQIKAGMTKGQVERATHAKGGYTQKGDGRMTLQYRQTFGPRGARWTAVHYFFDTGAWIVDYKEKSTTRVIYTRPVGGRR